MRWPPRRGSSVDGTAASRRRLGLGAAPAGVLRAVEPAVQVGPRASRPSRAVLGDQPAARAGSRGCALRSLWSLRPRMHEAVWAAARFGPRARRAWWWRAAAR
jgi:hypothetical protein